VKQNKQCRVRAVSRWAALLLGICVAWSGAASAAPRASKAVSAAASVRKAAVPAKRVTVLRGGDKRGKSARRVVARAAVAAEPPRLSFGEAGGLHAVRDPLDLKSSVALVVDQDTSEVLFSKNSQAVLPIASLTKLMTALVVVESRAAMADPLQVTEDDIDTEKGSRSRLVVGSELSRGELLHLALMSSENRAANALGRHHPGGLPAFVAAMNRKAASLGMTTTRFVEPTGLSSDNQSSASDLARLVKAAYQYPLLRELSTSPELAVALGHRTVQFHNTNKLVLNPTWEIGLQKTGYIVEAGRCLVMQARLAGRQLILVFLDSTGKYSRLGDAERVRRWLESAEGVRPVRHLPGRATTGPASVS
jgi:serine-type D-Ala-D-Ala endopeptidase (penicillin-binding protein 7)